MMTPGIKDIFQGLNERVAIAVSQMLDLTVGRPP
jgi:hypothetical protein